MQKSLFNNLPTNKQPSKDTTKALLEKSKSKQTKKKTVRSSTNNLAGKVATVVELLKSRLVDDGSYELIRDNERFREYMREIRKVGKASLDIETNSLDTIDGMVVGLSIYIKGTKAVYVAINHTDIENNRIENQVDVSVVAEEFNKSRTQVVKWIYHNAKFDIRGLKNYFKLQTYPNVYYDTQVGANFLNENEKHGLKYLWSKYIGLEEAEADTFSSLFDKIPFNYIPMEIGYIYASKDVVMTYDLYEFQIPYLNKSATCIDADLFDTSDLVFKVEIPLITVVAAMEDVGVSIDKEYASELSVKYNAMLQDALVKSSEVLARYDVSSLAEPIREKLDNPINIGSPAQLSIIFYDLLGFKSPDRNAPRTTNADAVDILKDRYPEHKDLFDVLLEYRGLQKLVSTYIDKMPRLVKESTNRLHGQFNQNGAKTGRFSSKDPNLQNIPSKNKDIRKMFIAKEGYVLISSDYSQQEPRVLAHLCATLFNDYRMVEAYEKLLDLYSWVASEVYQVSYEDCKEFKEDGTKNPPECKQRRNSVKEILLGLMYGRGVDSVAEKLGTTKEEAQAIIDMLFNTFPAIKQVTEYFLAEVQEKGYLKTIWGRKRRIPEVNLPKYELKDRKTKEYVDDVYLMNYYFNKMDNTKWHKEKSIIKNEAWENGYEIIENTTKISDAIRQILNSEVQGTSADMTKEAMVRLYRNEELRLLGFNLVLTVHDEIIGEAPKENAERCSEIMSQIMIEAAKDKISVPMKCDAEIMERWSA